MRRVGVCLVPVAFSSGTSKLVAAARGLPFEEQMEAQESIDRVYYLHQFRATKPFG